MFSRTGLVLALILVAGGRPAQSEEDPKLLEDIDVAIDSGVEFILNAVQGPSGWMPDDGKGNEFGTGYAAIQVYALVKSDVSYLHPVVQKGISVIESFNFERVYSVSLYIMAYDAMIEQIDADARLGEARAGGDRAKFLEKMKAATDWLIAARLRGIGAWNYQPPPAKADPRTRRYDHSNTQFAVLALGVAAERKLKVPPEVWEEIAAHFIADQEQEGELVKGGLVLKRPEPEGEKDVVKRVPDKKKADTPQRTVAHKAQSAFEEGKVRARGWKYLPDEMLAKGAVGQRRQFSMVCAGVSSLLIAQRNLPGWASGPKGQSLQVALRDGLGWLVRDLDGNRRPGQYYYDFYSLEKVGDLGEVEAFGKFHWYEECARAILRLQRANGSFGAEYRTNAADIRSDTSLGLLFLGRATDLAARSRPLARATRAGGTAGPGEDPESGQGWIYLPSLKGEVSLARLFRLLRYRPIKQVLKLAEEAVKVQDPERIDDLVHPLVMAWKRSNFTQVQDLARKLLVSATGVDSSEEKAYLDWAERWREVLRIGKAGDSAESEKLLEWLGTVEGTPLKLKVIWALQRTGARTAMGRLIDCLEDRDPVLREAAYSALTFLSGQALPFHSKGPEKTRAEEVRAWRNWHALEGSKSSKKE